MIIIDQVADITLAKTLDRLLTQPDYARAVYFNLKNSPQAKAPGFTEKVIAAAREHIASAAAQLYLCEDGDIFILAPTLASKEAHKLLLDVGALLSRAVTDDWAQIHDLPQQVITLLGILEKKQDLRRDAAAAEQKKLDEVQKARKREAILNSIVASAANDIAARRAARTAPEFMIIEDDAFSRRLVENVLGKQYKLTGLGEATDALSTYARIAPDILFLDINLPDVTGHELLEKIVALDPEAYVVMLSGNADKENITQAMGLGAKGFIAKPFTREKLFQYIERCPTLKQVRS